MISLILGGSGSGKSFYAEKCMEILPSDCKKYYIATMRNSDCETQRKIERHRMQRSGKNFYTIEQPTKVAQALNRMSYGKKAALLECISNLTANEMFDEQPPKPEACVIAEIVENILRLAEGVTHLVIVSNQVFSDGYIYDEMTMAYIRAMGKINEKLAEVADEVIEVVVGIPTIIKKD